MGRHPTRRNDTTELPAGNPSISLGPWQAPSGADYEVISGQGIPGLARVSLVNGNGDVAATEPATPAAYVIFIPADKFTSYSHLVFTDKAMKSH